MTRDSQTKRESGESALSRWSRRKLEARQAEVKAPAPVEPDTAQDALPADEADDRQPLLTDADMPDIDSLTEESDFSPFMSAGVSDELRNLALRKLFGAPVFNIRDGLDEYDDDFTQFEKLGSIITSDMKHRVEMEQQKLREQLAGEDAAGDAVDAERIETVAHNEDVDEVEEIEDDDETALLAAAEVDSKPRAKADHE